MRRNLNSTFVTLLLAAAILPGCKKEEAPPPAATPKPAQPAKPASQPAPVQKPLSSAVKAGGSLDFSRRSDPFKPYAPPAPAPVPVPQAGAAPSGEVLPIQSFEVGRFKVAGIITGLNENKALVIDPNGKGYVVQVGMQIGNANGRIVKITPSTVEVVERFREGSGRVKQRRTVLTLAKKR